MQHPISITAINSISPLGSTLAETWKNYLQPKHCIRLRDYDGRETYVSELSDSAKTVVRQLRASDSNYKRLDDTVLFAICASREAIKTANWKGTDNFGINIGSSRGATALFERYHQDFLSTKKTETLASPTTTLGNISSWVAHDLQTKGPEISHSITCSTALHALLNGIAWITSGMTDKFLVGGSEAPLTPFTIAQMQALKIYAKTKLDNDGHPEPVETSFPCRALDLSKKKNSMVLGEGASMACLESGKKKNALAIIEGIGYATEILEHNTSISTEARCFQKSMKMALADTKLEEVDVIVMHAPGTKRGDLSEFKAIEKVFGGAVPSLTTNKWKLGHTFGASGMLSIEFAILMLQHQQFIEIPFLENSMKPKILNKILVNAVGFGGNAVSVLLSKK